MPLEQTRELSEQRREDDAVRFEGNGSKRWDGREYEVPGRTVVRLGRLTEEGLEEAEGPPLQRELILS